MSFWEQSEWTGELSWKQLRINKFQLFKYCHLPSCWGKNIYARSLLNSDYEKELWKCEAGALFQVSLSARVFSVWGTLFYGCRQINGTKCMNTKQHSRIAEISRIIWTASPVLSNEHFGNKFAFCIVWNFRRKINIAGIFSASISCAQYRTGSFKLTEGKSLLYNISIDC